MNVTESEERVESVKHEEVPVGESQEETEIGESPWSKLAGFDGQTKEMKESQAKAMNVTEA